MQPEADSPPGDAGPTAMKLDTPGDDAVSPEDAADDTSDPPAAPQTPDRKPTNSQPPSEARSSRVTINVRTPSRPLETIPSSPLSAPSTKEHSLPTPIPISMDDEVKVSVEETEVEMAQVDVGADTPISSGSAASSPPVELVHVDQGDEDAELEDDEPQVILIQDNPIDMPDPTPDLPFHDVAETYSDTIARLTQYMPSRKCLRPPTRFPSSRALFLASSSIDHDPITAFVCLLTCPNLYRRVGLETFVGVYREISSLCQNSRSLLGIAVLHRAQGYLAYHSRNHSVYARPKVSVSVPPQPSTVITTFTNRINR